MLAHAAAQHADLDRVVEQDEVDGDLHRVDGVVVLGVERRVALERDAAERPVAVQPDRPEVDRPGRGERRQPLERLRQRPRHRVQQVQPADGVGEDPGHERALGDLEALLVALQVLPLAVDRPPRRQEVREAVGDRVHEPGDAQRAPQPVRDLVVDGRDVARRRLRRGHAPATIVSRPAQWGARSSRLSTLPAPDLGSGSVRSSIRLGTL